MVELNFSALPHRLFGPDTRLPGYLAARWLFLRALGLIFFSAFYSLAFQIRGLIGPRGILPARDYLTEVARILGVWRFWFAPSVFWWSASDRALLAVCIVGMLASLLLVLNLCPRGMLVICLAAFLSFVSTAQDFASYQSDGMLLEAGFISLFFAPAGWRPRWGILEPPSRASRFLLVWLLFRIYFESGIAKMLGHDPEWRNFTALDQYYQNGPLPTWIGWYAQHLPHGFHVATALLTLALELVLIFGVLLPRRSRILLFFIITPWQLGIILTSNYAFLNYLVLVLGFLLLDDTFLARLLPRDLRAATSAGSSIGVSSATAAQASDWKGSFRLWVQGFFLTWVFYATSILLLSMFMPQVSWPVLPVRALQPFRFANDFGLFAVMTRDRYEIEFQGSRDGQTWTAYPFRYKPQDLHAPPRIYAPYQPRFDWNLWFASLGGWRQYPFVLRVEQRLLTGEPDVLALFGGNPFPGEAPQQIRAVLWQYWFSDWKEKREQELWWRREWVGLYAPTLARAPDGKIFVLEWPEIPPAPSPGP
ncbi:MAG: lipase maturation factor family protein [Acidobacteriia bacterium]|nr:lipase maturation factor family protein [Terriglobia bacterium]